MLVCLLFAICLASAQGTSFTFKYTTDWLDSTNWENGALPTAGSVVSFPQSFSEFNLQDCTAAANQCPQGGIVSIQSADESVAQIEFARLELPLNGQIAFQDDTIVAFEEFPIGNDSVVDSSWKDRGNHQFDFNCAANWVINGTNSNPDFAIPCVNDTAIFPSGKSFMTYVPRNTFISQLLPVGSSVFSDSHQFTGSTINILNNNCPEPFFATTSPIYCADICVNSCPQLNPSVSAGLEQQIQQSIVLSSYVNLAITSAQNNQAIQTSPIVVKGSQLFPVPLTASLANIELVRQNIVNLLPKNVDFPLVISCLADLTSINCNFTSNIATSILSSFTSDSVAPYSFTPGLLFTLFAEPVSFWFQQQIATTAAITAQSQLSNFFSVSVQVPVAFVDLLPTSDSTRQTLIAAALSASFNNLPASNIFNVIIVDSTTSQSKTLILNVVGSSGVTMNSVVNVLTNINLPLVVTLPDGSLLPFYNATRDTVQPSQNQLDVIEVSLTNQALFSSLPLSSGNVTSFTLSLRQYIESQSQTVGLGSQILATTLLPSTSARRSTGQVIMYMTLPHSSPLLAFLTQSYFANFTFGGIKVSSISAPSVLSVMQLQQAILNNQISQLQSQSAAAATSAQSSVSSLAQNGAPPTQLATGTYGWNNVDIVHDDSNQIGLTNDLCALFLAFNVDQQQFKSQLATSMAKILAIPSSGIVFPPSALKCSALYPLQTNADQRATFIIQSMTLTTLYTRFGSNAPYVVYSSPNVNHSARPFEITAPLSTVNVKNALSDALRLFVLGVLQQSLANITAFDTALLPTSAPATSQAAASFPIIPIAAAAGGALLLVVIIIVVVARRNRKPGQTPKRSKAGRDVVAFENPMYDTSKGQATQAAANATDGLYDEPSFLAKADRVNPIFSSHDNLTETDDFSPVISLLANQPDSVYNEPTQPVSEYNEPTGFSLATGQNETEEPDENGGYLDVNPPGFEEPQINEGLGNDTSNHSFGFAEPEQSLYDNGNFDEPAIEMNQPHPALQEEPEQIYQDIDEDYPQEEQQPVQAVFGINEEHLYGDDGQVTTQSTYTQEIYDSAPEQVIGLTAYSQEMYDSAPEQTQDGSFQAFEFQPTAMDSTPQYDSAFAGDFPEVMAFTPETYDSIPE